MPFEASRWPNAVTVADLIERAMQLGVHCLTCARHSVLDPASLPFAPESPIPSLAGRFKCARCGSKQTEARPEYSNDGRLTGYTRVPRRHRGGVFRSQRHRPNLIVMTDRERQEAWDAFDLLHDALSELCPPGSLPSKEEIDRQFGPTFAGHVEALARAVAALYAVAYPKLNPEKSAARSLARRPQPTHRARQ